MGNRGVVSRETEAVTSSPYSKRNGGGRLKNGGTEKLMDIKST